MTWQAPRPTLKIALGYGRFTDNSVIDADSDHADWTDLTNRIKGQWTVDLCGRDSVRDDFRPGGLTVVLDNDDRMLDPSNPDGLVYAPDGQGLPGAPVIFDLTYGATTERRFTGYLASPAWSGAGTPRMEGSGRSNTVTLVARDRLEWSGDLPDSTWTAATMASWPDWYLPMDPPNAVLDTGSEIPDRSGTTDAHATVTSPDGALSRPDSWPGGWVPWLKVPPDSYFTSAAADLMPDGDSLNVTVALWWECNTLTAGQESVVARMVPTGDGPTSATPRWELIVGDDGEARIFTYDAAGAPIDSDVLPRTYVARWDNTGPHFVVVRFESGNNCTVWFGGDRVDINATSTVYESDLICGPSDVDSWFDEVTVWRGGSPNRLSGALDDDEVAGLLLEAGGYIGQWFGHTYHQRLAAWAAAAGVNANADWTLRFRCPTDDPATDGFVSLNVASVPQNIADAFRQTVRPGTVVCDRYGFLVARTVDALKVGSDWEANYVTTSAHFTDESGDLTGVKVRHAGVSRSAVDEDSVINRVEATYYNLIDFGPETGELQLLTYRVEDATVVDGRTSKQQFGTRVYQDSVDRYGWVAQAARIDELLARHAWPVAGFDSLAIDATRGDDIDEDRAEEADRLIAWLMTAEPELAVNVTYQPNPGDDPQTVTGQNLQGLRIAGTTHTLRAQARVFKS